MNRNHSLQVTSQLQVFHQCSWFPSPYKPTDASEKHNLCLHQCSNHYLPHDGITHPTSHCHTTLSTPKNANGPRNTTGNCHMGPLHVSSFLSSGPPSSLPSSGGWRVSVGLFSPLYKCQSHSSMSKISKVSSSQGRLNHSVQNSPWRSSSHTSSTNIRRYSCLCVEYTQCHPVVKTTAIIKLRWETQGYEERVFA